MLKSFLLADGMGAPTQMATRVFINDMNVQLSFEKFPYTGLSKVFYKTLKTTRIL